MTPHPAFGHLQEKAVIAVGTKTVKVGARAPGNHRPLPRGEGGGPGPPGEGSFDVRPAAGRSSELCSAP